MNSFACRLKRLNSSSLTSCKKTTSDHFCSSDSSLPVAVAIRWAGVTSKHTHLTSVCLFAACVHQILQSSSFLLHSKMNLMTNRFAAALNTDVQKGGTSPSSQKQHVPKSPFLNWFKCTEWTKGLHIVIIWLMITWNQCLQTQRSTPFADNRRKTLTWWLILTNVGIFSC